MRNAQFLCWPQSRVMCQRCLTPHNDSRMFEAIEAMSLVLTPRALDVCCCGLDAVNFQRCTQVMRKSSIGPYAAYGVLSNP